MASDEGESPEEDTFLCIFNEVPIMPTSFKPQDLKYRRKSLNSQPSS